ncbi:Hint domain-containing protein [Bombella pollinis]|uniref:Hint domain-containing protein n=1 Tax=Bombella pollinis TaxID=2967337 RepID=A0ABT3WR02_9PROT|nr:Hint domain-containing protein [Bombella pollinis]MCX5620147.1 Hint domain-containing protein [Bombella pollinis]
MAYSFDSKYDNLPPIGTAQVPNGWATVLSGAQNTVGLSTNISNYYVSGLSNGSNGAIINSLVAAFNHNITNGIAVDGGSIAIAGNNSFMYGATALSAASIEAIGGGVISGGVVGYSGAVFAGSVTSKADPNQGGIGPITGIGTAINSIVGSGGYALVGGGGADFTVKGYSVNGSGGLMLGGTFNPGSLYAVGNGGTASGGTVGGQQSVFSNGLSLNQLFVGSAATQAVMSKGLASQSTVLSGATGLNSGGTTSSVIAVSGGTLIVEGGTYVSWLNKGYATSAYGYGSGTSFNNMVSAGGTEIVNKDGTASRSTILSGGIGTVNSGGLALSPLVSGGTEIGSAGGIISGGTALQKGNITLLSDALGSNLSAQTSGNIVVSAAGTGNVLTASTGGTIRITSGGTGSAVTANAQGTVLLNSGGTAGNLVINTGGTSTIDAGAVIYSGATLNDSNQVFAPVSGVTADYLLASAGQVVANVGATISGIYAAGPNGTGLVTQSGDSVGAAIAGYDPQNKAAVGGTVIVSGGAVANNVGARMNGLLILGSGGTASNFAPISNGTASILAGASVADGATAQLTGGLISLASGVHVTSISATGAGNNAGFANISSGGTVDALSLGSRGTGNIASGVTVSSLTINSGGSALLDGGATVPNVTLSGGTIAIPAGGAGLQTLSALNGGVGVINSGANVSSVFISGGNATVQSGAYVSRLTILSGGSGVLMSGASVQHIDVASGGWVSGARVSNNDELVVGPQGTAQDTVVTFDSGKGPYARHPYTMVTSGGYLSGATVLGADGTNDPEQLGGLLTIASGATLINTSMGYNARIRIYGMKYTDKWQTAVSGNTVFVTQTDSNGSNASTWQLSLKGNYNAGGFILNDDGEGNTVLIYEKCFLAGSMIRTPKGEKAVERLRKGETICVLNEGREETREITAVIQRRARVNTSQPEDLAGWSVIVAKDAFGPGLPNKDLSVTPEHCFYFEGHFVPARMLINGTSIRYDHSQVEYDYYHIKTEPHSVIWANDVLTESWLDTDLQDHYEANEENTLRLVEQEQLNWNENAAAPLGVTQEFVKPLHDKFAARAAELGLTDPEAEQNSQDGETTTDPAPYIRLETGETLHPQRHEAGRYLFTLPAYTQRVTVGSRTFRPSEAVGPHMDDRRQLGVLVGQVSLWNGGRESIITRHLTDRGLNGWDVIEAGPHRWTNGEAELPLHDSPPVSASQQVLAIEVQAGGPYRLPS